MTMLTYQEVLGLRGASADTGTNFYALIDHAGMPGVVHELNRTRADWVSLFEGSRDEGALSVAPLLILIDSGASAFRTRALVKWMCEHGTYTSSIAFLSSPLSLCELARRLSLRLDAALPDKIEIVLRFFDGRILESLLSTLYASQKAAFLNVAHQWWYVNRAGQIISVDAKFSAIETSDVPLILDAAQEDLLLDACEPDQIGASLLTCVPHEYQKLSPCLRHQFILNNVTRARVFGLDSTYELSLYCSLALLYGIDFPEQPAWKDALTMVRTGKTDLTDVVMKIEQSKQLQE